jgi:hypothetical protein
MQDSRTVSDMVGPHLFRRQIPDFPMGVYRTVPADRIQDEKFGIL